MKFIAIQTFSPTIEPERRAAVERANRFVCDAYETVGDKIEYVALENPETKRPGAVAATLAETNADYFVVFPENYVFCGNCEPAILLGGLLEDLGAGNVLFPVDCVAERRRHNPARPNPQIAFGRVGDEARAVFERWQTALVGFDATRYASEFWVKVYPYTDGLVLLRNYYRLAAEGGYLLRRVDDFATFAAQIPTDAKENEGDDNGRVEYDAVPAFENHRASARRADGGENADATAGGDGTGDGNRGDVAGNADACGNANAAPGSDPLQSVSADEATAGNGNEAENGDGTGTGAGNGDGRSGDGGNGDGDAEPVKPTKKRRTRKKTQTPGDLEA